MAQNHLATVVIIEDGGLSNLYHYQTLKDAVAGFEYWCSVYDIVVTDADFNCAGTWATLTDGDSFASITLTSSEQG